MGDGAPLLLSYHRHDDLQTVEGAWNSCWRSDRARARVILRWYWWRINAWSEISAMIASFVISLFGIWKYNRCTRRMDLRGDAVVMLITVALSTIICFRSPISPSRSRTAAGGILRAGPPGGPGLRRISDKLGYGGESIPGGAMAWTNWLAGVIAVYASLFGIGKLVFGELMTGLILVIIAALAFAWIAKAFREEDAGERAQRDIVAVAGD